MSPPAVSGLTWGASNVGSGIPGLTAGLWREACQPASRMDGLQHQVKSKLSKMKGRNFWELGTEEDIFPEEVGEDV